MSYNVYLVSYLGAPRDHHAIFVETKSDKSGYIFQVIGDIQSGMSFGHKDAKRPEDSTSFVSQEHIGTVSEANYDRIESIVETIEPPKKQFDGPRRINPREPLRRCQEWTADAVEALKSAGVLES
jgi:hypothetical protein